MKEQQRKSTAGRTGTMRNQSFNKIKFLMGMMVLAPESSLVNSLVSTGARSSIRRISVPGSSRLEATTKDVVYDGPEWTSLQDCLGGVKTSSSCGKMTVVVGAVEGEAGDKIVGIAADSNSMLNGEGPETVPIHGNSNLQVYSDSIAKLPPNVKEQDAINTVIAALTGVECCLPKVEGVGGSDDNSFVSGKKVVVLGGSDYACFAAEGLATMGSKVYLVSTNNINLNHNNVEVLPPAVGDDEIGFATHVGEFESLLDTADDERPSMRFSTNDDDDDDGGMMSRGTTLRLLQQRHKCERYVSSMTKAQDIVNGEGVFFGPGKVKDHVKQIQQQLDSEPYTFQSIVPPSSFGKTVETLLSKGVVYKSSKDFVTSPNGNTIVRGWSLKDFMETTTWPSDSSGGGSRMVRYGLPVLEEEEEEEEEFQLTMLNPEFIDREAWDEDIRKEEEAEAKQDQQNPFVKQIVGEQGMYDTIVREQRDCVLFLSAKFCRTCKTLNPRYTTLARQTMENNEEILFAKAEAAGEVGKSLSKLLNVDSVPAFVLFRKGRRFGPNMSISKMPSKQLKAAIDLLESGMDWDAQAIQEAGEKSR